MPDAFTNTMKVIKSYIPTVNALSKIEISIQQVAESMFRQKRGRPIGSKDKKPRKRKVINSRKNLIENKKIQEVMDITNCKNVEETQVDNVAHNIIHENENSEPKSINECCDRKDWPKWKEAIQVKLNSLSKREVFGPVVHTPKGVKPVGFKWEFVCKRNENNDVTRYNA